MLDSGQTAALGDDDMVRTTMSNAANCLLVHSTSPLDHATRVSCTRLYGENWLTKICRLTHA